MSRRRVSVGRTCCKRQEQTEREYKGRSRGDSRKVTEEGGKVASKDKS
jgi:hypothetical protein